MGRYEEIGSVTSEHQESLLEDYDFSSPGNDEIIENTDESKDNKSLISLDNRKDSMNSTKRNECRENVCVTELETEKSKREGFPVTIFKLVSDINVTDETTEASSNELQFVGFEGSQKFPVKVKLLQLFY